jgi:cytochrome c oxidase subunit II
MHQYAILTITLLGMALVAAPFILTVRSTASSTPPMQWLTESARGRLIWSLTGLGAVVTIASLWVWPHDVSGAAADQLVNATGHQWYWEIDRKAVTAGSPVVFNVHSGDVNHGMGVYDADDRLLFQVQAMPGYVNRVQYTFEKPGTYRLLCMEFCGIAHHNMIEKITVTAGKN